MKYFVSFFTIFLFTFFVHAQKEFSSFTVTGKVLESNTSQVMEYCTVSIFDVETSKLLSGTITNEVGVFSLAIKKPGNYFLKVSYIGFETIEIKEVNLNPENPNFVVKDILLKSDAKNLKEVEVVGAKSTVRYEMDKKVVDVSKNIAASNGSAIDVLEAAPSVEVGLDGTVKMRGNSNFMVLINGRPSTLSGSEALQQIPASNIKNIELITNPSAKYDAGNSGGIINVILKEEKKIGTSGMVRIGVGTFSNYNASINVKHNVKKFGFTFSASTRKRNRPGESMDSLRTSFDNVVTTNKETERTRSFGGYRFNYGVEYNVVKNHDLILDMSLGRWGMDVNATEKTHLKNETLSTDDDFINVSDQNRFSNYFGPSLSYNGVFKNKSSLATYLGYSQRDFKEKITNAELDFDNKLLANERSTENKFVRIITARIDYTLPVKKSKFEFGGKLRSSWNDEENNNFQLDLAKNIYVPQTFNNEDIFYSQKVYGLYSMFYSEWKKFKYSLGFRAEYIDREIEFRSQQVNNNYYQWNYFPSFSLSYQINEKSNIYISFARKIDRFPGYYLRPVPIKTGSNSYFQGNPSLRPRLVNALELGWSNTFKKSTNLSVEAFYKYNTDDFQFITTAFEDGFSTLNRPYNIGVSHDIGLETNFSFMPLKWLSADIMATASYYIQDAEFDSEKIDNKNFRWNARFNTYFTVTKTTKIQFSGRYSSKQVSGFTEYTDNLIFSLGASQSFLKRALNITFNIRNVFYTQKDASITSYENYYSESKGKILWPFLDLGLSYKINNFRQSRRQTEGGGGDF